MDKHSQAAMGCFICLSEELGVFPGWDGNRFGTDQPF